MRQATAARSLRAMPLVVLSHCQPLDLPPMEPSGISQVLEPAWAASQTQLAALVLHASHIVSISGHYIQ
jgi:hypothetical protein